MSKNTQKQDQSTDLNSKKPMDGDQILEGFQAAGFTGETFRLRCFTEGVRWAEKYHGIKAPTHSTRKSGRKRDDL